jgi:hypothetical protein
MRVTEKQARDYFETLVENQPNDVVNMLMELFSRDVKVEDFIGGVVEDILDIED